MARSDSHRHASREVEQVTHDIETFQSWCNETEKALGPVTSVATLEGETIVLWRNRRRLVWRKEPLNVSQ